jgi:hypothetical protein
MRAHPVVIFLLGFGAYWALQHFSGRFNTGASG